jgi:cytochrome b involved in lipid metabolism
LPTDCWIIIQNYVYDATSYSSLHPGGPSRITLYCGQDATSAYSTQGGKGSHSASAYQDLSILKLGRLNESVVISDVSQKINDAIQSNKLQGKGESDDD